MSIRDLEESSIWFYDVKDQLKSHIYNQSEKAFAAGDAARDAVQSIEDLDSRRAWIRDRFIESIGGLPSSDTPLKPKITGTVECDGFRVEKVIFESRPKTYVTANLYVPSDVTTPRGAVIFLCGHHEQAKHQAEYQVVCQYLVRAGLIVLAQDPIGQGERFSYYEKSLGAATVSWGVPEHDYAGRQSLVLGDSIARYFVHDAMRGIDYLLTRPEVDPQKIGVTGNSGGGTQTALMMLCDPRIAAAAPATFIMNRKTYMYTGCGQDAEQIWPGMTALGFDHEDILLMMSPKPVRVLAVKYDFFPIEGTHATVERCRRFWDMYGAAGLDMVEDASGHMYTRTLARAAAEFFSHHLLGRKVSVSDESVVAMEPSKLWCTASGQVKCEIEGARIVYDENQDRLAASKEARESIAEPVRKANAVAWLKQKVLANRKPCEPNPRLCNIAQFEGICLEQGVWWAQEGLFNHAYVFRDNRFADKRLPVTIAVWNDGTKSLQPHIKWIMKTCASGRAVMVLDTSGVGRLEPNPTNPTPVHEFYGVIHKLCDDLIWLNDSLAALRTFDVLRSLDMIEMWPGVDASDIRLYASGNHSVYAQLASALDERIKELEVAEGFDSYADWVRRRHYDTHDIMSAIFPDVLKYFDVSDL